MQMEETMLKGETNGAPPAAAAPQKTGSHRRVVAQTAVGAVAIGLAVVAAVVWTPRAVPVPGGACDVTAVHEQLAAREPRPRYCASTDLYYYCECKACNLHQACPGGKRMSDLLECACPHGAFYSTPHWGMLAVVGLLTPVSAVCMYAGARRWFKHVFGGHREHGVPPEGSACDSDTGCYIMTAVGTTALSWVLASSFSYESPEASTYMLAAATQVFGVGMLLPLIGALIVSYWKPHPLAQG